MTFIKKLWIKSKLYADLIVESFLVNLWATITVGALLVLAPPFIGLALSITAALALAALAVGLNFWIWSNSMDMSKKFWYTELPDPDMLQVLLDNFKPKKNSTKKVKKALLEQKINFLNRFDRSGHTALVSFAFNASLYARAAANPIKTNKERSALNAKAQACIEAIAVILNNTPESKRSSLMKTPDKDGYTIWSIMLRLAATNPDLLDKVLEILNDKQRLEFIGAQHPAPTGSRHFPNAFHYAIFYLGQEPKMADIINCMLVRLTDKKTELLTQKNTQGGYSIIEEAVNSGNPLVFAMILRHLPNATALIKGHNDLGIKLFNLAIKEGCIDIVRYILQLPDCLTSDDIYGNLALIESTENTTTVLKSMVCCDSAMCSYADMAKTISMLLPRMNESQRAALILTPNATSGLTLLEEAIVMQRRLAANALFDSLSPVNRPTIDQLRSKIQGSAGSEGLPPKIQKILAGIFSARPTPTAPSAQAEPAAQMPPATEKIEPLARAKEKPETSNKDGQPKSKKLKRAKRN